MTTSLRLLFLILCLAGNANGQQAPAEGSELNYRIVGFLLTKAASGRLEIALGRFNDDVSFERNLILTKEVTTKKIMAEVPFFGREYTWRYKGMEHEKFHHFKTMTADNIDSNVNRLRILQKAMSFKDAYVFVDGTRALYDMGGRPIWFLPNIWHFPGGNFEVRDMKQTPQGTVTFILGDSAFEVNYEAKILWRGPNNGIVSGKGGEGYHHQLTRLGNGHYMVLGNQYITGNNISGSKPDARIPFGTVIEYDEHSKVVWSWKSWDYFKGTDLSARKNAAGAPDPTVHENAFYFDEKTRMLYVSFRNASTVLKIKYPEGNVLAAYGDMSEGKSEGLFCHQHSCKVSEQGELYLFNNNTCSTPAIPTLIKMREKTGRLEKAWEYVCILDDGVKRTPMDFVSGGNVAELPDHSILASMSAPNWTRVFIVSQNRKMLWNAAPERKNLNNGAWMPLLLYSCNIVRDKKELERLVWSAQ